MAPDQPLCFVLMPFGKKPDASGRVLDFDEVYKSLIRPAVAEAGLEPLRADEELIGGIVHRALFERLILCPFAVADVTTANANVAYELGVRHAFRPRSTVMTFAEGTVLPFDIGPVRGHPYGLDEHGCPSQVDRDRQILMKHLITAKNEAGADSPIYQLLEGLPKPDVSRLKTDVFREKATYSAELRSQLANARRQKDAAAIDEVRGSFGKIEDQEVGVLVDLLLSYRAVKAFQSMVDLVPLLPAPERGTTLVQEQYAFALNRTGRHDEAEQLLQELIRRHGPSSEACGLLGRVYKDRWQAAQSSGDVTLARGLLTKAIEAYLTGFQSDWRDHYPGINCVTLMEVSDPPDPRRLDLLPVVTYSVLRRVETSNSDYWDHATLVELAVLARDQDRAEHSLADAVVRLDESWKAESTAGNLKIINNVRERRNELDPWAREIEHRLAARGSGSPQ